MINNDYTTELCHQNIRNLLYRCKYNMNISKYTVDMIQKNANLLRSCGQHPVGRDVLFPTQTCIK